MPTDPNEWSVSNVLVVHDEEASPIPTNYMLSIWFGPMRAEGSGNEFFKCWGSPHLVPEDAPSIRDHRHSLMVGTPEFIEARDELRTQHQGVRCLWFVGGYTLEYETQNSSLRSANLVAQAILSRHETAVNESDLSFLMREGEVAAAAPNEQVLRDPEFPAHFALLDAIERTIVTRRPDHPAVRAWREGIGERRRRRGGPRQQR